MKNLELLCLLGFVLLWLSFLIALKYLRVTSGVASSFESWGRGGVLWDFLGGSFRFFKGLFFEFP